MLIEVGDIILIIAFYLNASIGQLFHLGLSHATLPTLIVPCGGFPIHTILHAGKRNFLVSVVSE